MERKDFEIMAPVGSPECLAAALRAGADSIYFGIENLNMRAHSASTFSIDDLKRIAEECRLCGVKSYLTVNTIIYGEDLPLMRQILDAAKEANISAVIASDIAVMSYCKQIGQEVHLSTQLNISNIEALRFYAQFADVVVLARELNMDQVAEIYRRIQEENICGPKGELIRIEMFCHGALCMAISGKCYLSESNWGRSANRGECMQLCRRRYTVKDAETGTELDIENKYIMSPRDLKTISFLDRLMESGVRVMKIEGRARGPEYVDTVVRCYNEAIEAVLHDKNHPEETPQFTEDQKAKWDERLSRVFNRGFWDGYYQGSTIMEYTANYGSLATEKKMYCGKVVRYFSKLGVAEFKIEACELNKDDEIMVTGPTTGCLRLTAKEIRNDDGPVDTAKKGWYVSISTEGTKVRRNDKLFVVQKTLDARH
jgi:putative protease